VDFANLEGHIIIEYNEKSNTKIHVIRVLFTKPNVRIYQKKKKPNVRP
jgi:hypothetical protein